MKQAKKIFTRMCLNNWGGVTHKVLEFHEYVNLFSGKSGSGKSTVMDAIQVVLYGSFSSGFLNKAADDAKNRRSVLSYLRGEQKDGTANREGKDFCSALVLEIKDTGTGAKTCVGIGFEVGKKDSELKKYLFFSHSGEMPEPEYLTETGSFYTNRDIRGLVEQRLCSSRSRGRSEVNRIYASREAYLHALYDVILGYIDGKRFCIMEKSSIALKMTNGTGQFIRDYMFPRSTGDVIEKISDQLGAYRDIQEKIQDMKRRIELLSEVQEAGRRKSLISTELIKAHAMVRCIEVEELRGKIAAAEEEMEQVAEELSGLEADRQKLELEREATENEWIQVTADLKASDLGAKERQLEELEKRRRLLENDSLQWRKVTDGLHRWEEDQIVTDYVSNPMLHKIEAFCRGRVTEEECRQLRESILEARQNLEEELEDYSEEKRKTEKELKELRRLAEDMQNDRKPYPARLREARKALEDRLSSLYGRSVRVRILADLFDVRDKEWKNAIEGRMGRLKLALVTEPKYAHDAAVMFRRMKGYEEVDLIDTAAVEKSGAREEEGSLYEAVETELPYVDACLKRYLGGIRKCRSVEELAKVRDGVMPDCYSYSGFVFRHLKKNDYEKYACIGSRVSKVKLEEYLHTLERLEGELAEQNRIITGLKAARDFECLHNEDAYFVRLSESGEDLEEVLHSIEELHRALERLREGRYRELEQKKEELGGVRKKRQEEIHHNRQRATECLKRRSGLEGEIRTRREELEERLAGHAVNEQLEAEVQELLKSSSGQAVRSRQRNRIAALEGQEQEEAENLQIARNRFIREYPSLGFNGMEKSNEGYEKLLRDYQSDYEPRYEAEFEKQCNTIYRSLRENVIATIHGDINAARRHTQEINRLLRKTNFADSTYQIKIEPAKNENGQFYEMLTAPELDSKNISSHGFDGQISLGEDEFYQKYEQQIRLLTDKFMPVRSGEEKRREQRQREMEQYADYRNYLSFSMYEQVTDENGRVIRENFVDEMAGRDSGGEGQNPKYVALLAGFAMLYMQQSSRDSRIRLVLLDEAFSKMDQERSAVCLKYARKLELQLIVCVPDERLQSLIRNVDCVYGFRRHRNQISMMHIDKGDYLKLMEGEDEEG